MKIQEFGTTGREDEYLEQIGNAHWSAAQYLYVLLKENRLDGALGEGARVLLLMDGDELAAFCTYAPLDEIQPTDLSPWMGFLYTVPKWRGKGAGKKLADEVVRRAANDGKEAVYVSTGHVGLYEKYGFSFVGMMDDMDGEPSRVYMRKTHTEKN